MSEDADAAAETSTVTTAITPRRDCAVLEAARTHGTTMERGRALLIAVTSPDSERQADHCDVVEVIGLPRGMLHFEGVYALDAKAMATHRALHGIEDSVFTRIGIGSGHEADAVHLYKSTAGKWCIDSARQV